MKLIQELFQQGLVNESQKEQVLESVKSAGKTEEEALLEQGLIPEDSLFEFKSKVFKFPLKEIKAEDVPFDILEIIPEEAAINYKMSPFGKNEKSVSVGMVYPESPTARNALRFLAGQQSFDYEVFLISISDLGSLLRQRKTLKIETEKALGEIDQKNLEPGDFIKEMAPVKIMRDDAPVIKMVTVILKHAVEGNASDIHVEPGRDKLTVRFRLDGVLHSSLFLPLSVYPSVAARIKIISAMKIDEKRVPQDGRFSAKINNKDIDFRVSTFPALYGEKIEIRVLDPKEGLKSFDGLGLRGRSFDLVSQAIKKPYGLVLSTGPTGSGKTTTQYALLRILNQESVNIVTLEDPIEYSIPGINQGQIKQEVGFTFSRGLRQILRQDPNIIMVGEIRDEETADLVIDAALTGHIVLSTLHTNSAVGVVPRLIDMGVRPFLIPSALKLAISQRLIRILCSKCKEKVRPKEAAKKYILEKIKTMPESEKKSIKITEPLYIYQAKGCSACNFTGYTGRTGLFEVLSMTSQLADIIFSNPRESLIIKESQRQGMLAMEQEEVLKVLEGETTIEEVARIGNEN